MTQEILDCLSIKYLFLTKSKEEVIDSIKTEEELEKICNTICKISEQEDFFYSCDILIEKLQNLVYYKRFSQKHKKELVEMFNEIIDIINVYKSFTDSDKLVIIKDWIREQAEYRKLPYRNISKYSKEEIYDLILLDYYFIPILLGNYNNLIECEAINFINSINLLCNQYPAIFYIIPNALLISLSICEIAKEKTKGMDLIRVKKTIALLENIEDKIILPGYKQYKKEV